MTSELVTETRGCQIQNSFPLFFNMRGKQDADAASDMGRILSNKRAADGAGPVGNATTVWNWFKPAELNAAASKFLLVFA